MCWLLIKKLCTWQKMQLKRPVHDVQAYLSVGHEKASKIVHKKSREESEGKESGVEILINEPYTDGPGGSGQYTRKIYHVGSHLPGWFQAILPKSALQVEEEAWNAYPYTKTIYRCPFIQKFMLEIETRYYNDGGDQENVFNLSAAEQRNRVVDHLDIVRDTISSGDYKSEEDPELFKSKQTGRGPLEMDWRQKYSKAACDPGRNMAIMCAYKLCKVEFRYWGMQSKIERFIHDVGLRKTMLRAHRQAWCWQDEYYGLTMADIRKLERETQLALKKKMNEDADRDSTVVLDVTESTPPPGLSENNTSPPDSDVAVTSITTESHLPVNQEIPAMRLASTRLSGIDPGCRKESWASVRSAFSRPGSNLALSDWQQMDSLEQLRTPSSDEDEEFFDAYDELHGGVANTTVLLKSSSMDMLNVEESDFTDSHSGETATPLDRRMEQYLQSISQSGETSVPSMPLSQGGNCHTTVLFLVLHGGRSNHCPLPYAVRR
ncbi:Membrane-associated phosphatidylinositol transfer protein 1 [Lamellibrachia satsuma]|nr:Membrane-associated phosphatidylinositol transfer protein 1 [Lamellibrachia satsuma]